MKIRTWSEMLLLSVVLLAGPLWLAEAQGPQWGGPRMSRRDLPCRNLLAIGEFLLNSCRQLSTYPRHQAMRAAGMAVADV